MAERRQQLLPAARVVAAEIPAQDKQNDNQPDDNAKKPPVIHSATLSGIYAGTVKAQGNCVIIVLYYHARRLQMNDTEITLPAFSHPPKAVALDIDGTLLDSRGKLALRTSRAVAACLDRGLPVIIATSRPARAVRVLIGEELMNRCSLVMQNGAIGIGRAPLEGKIKETIPPDVLTSLIQALRETEPGLRLTAELEGYEFGTTHMRDPAALWATNSATPEMQLPLEDAIAKGPAKIAAGGLGRNITDIAAKIAMRFKGSLSVIVGDGILMNITLKSATKANTMRRLLEPQNIALKDVLAIGDDLPDIDMLTACGYAVAMGNAHIAVKSVCKYMTLSNDENGAALVLEKILDSL
jgi:Cof subfamily protein (haloacid dehalogenase superfamily)